MLSLSTSACAASGARDPGPHNDRLHFVDAATAADRLKGAIYQQYSAEKGLRILQRNRLVVHAPFISLVQATRKFSEPGSNWSRAGASASMAGAAERVHDSDGKPPLGV
jgi:hypothetical protein